MTLQVPYLTDETIERDAEALHAELPVQLMGGSSKTLKIVRQADLKLTLKLDKSAISRRVAIPFADQLAAPPGLSSAIRCPPTATCCRCLIG
jgi:hypothetical protein